MIYVTSPVMPDFDEFVGSLRRIWQTRNLTNNGEYLRAFEDALARWLGVPYVSVMTNGTLPLMLALRALGIEEGEVITTPYTFAATAGAVEWAGLTPVFADVREQNGTLSPRAVEACITSRTRAILPVHVHGYPCLVEEFAELSRRYDIPVIYDAAHAFGVKYHGKSLLLQGEMSTLSFHATKVFNTIEGGAVVCSTAEHKEALDRMRNFGITGETSVACVGLNAKMDEVRAAYGLLNLKNVDAAIDARRALNAIYDKALAGLRGVYHPALPEGVEYNYSHYPVYIDAEGYGRTRDELYTYMKCNGVHARRYFYPLLSELVPYNRNMSGMEVLSVAARLSSQVLCLPLYPHLAEEEILKISALIRDCPRKK